MKKLRHHMDRWLKRTLHKAEKSCTTTTSASMHKDADKDLAHKDADKDLAQKDADKDLAHSGGEKNHRSKRKRAEAEKKLQREKSHPSNRSRITPRNT